jgi:hypothetical protein
MYVDLLLAPNSYFCVRRTMPERLEASYVQDDLCSPDTFVCPRSSVKCAIIRRDWKTVDYWKYSNYSKDAPQPATCRYHAEIVVLVGENNGGRRHTAD